MEQSPLTLALLAAVGAMAGLIDSIAGGGGLLTLPALSLAFGPGVEAIGTNKINGVVAAGVAMIVYLRKRHPSWKRGIPYAICVGCGSVLGSLCSPHVPTGVFRWIMIVLLPILLVVFWKRDRWVEVAVTDPAPQPLRKRFWVASFFVGFYDGAFGPAGGTFMLLVPLMLGAFPLLQALLLSKMANTASAGFSLVSYAAQGYVHWRTGAIMATAMAMGAYAGATLASRHASRILRPVLTGVVALLILRLLSQAI